MERAAERRSKARFTPGAAFALSANRVLLQNPYHYRDKRTDGSWSGVLRAPADEIYAVTGIQFLPFTTLYQLFAASADPPALDAATSSARFHTCSIRADRRADRRFTNATTTQFIDARTRILATTSCSARCADAHSAPSRAWHRLDRSHRRAPSLQARGWWRRRVTILAAGRRLLRTATGLLSSGTCNPRDRARCAVITRGAGARAELHEEAVSTGPRGCEDIARLWRSCVPSHWAEQGFTSQLGLLALASSRAGLPLAF